MSDWTAADDNKLRAFYEQYPASMPVPVADIAAILRRSEQAVRTRVWRLAIGEAHRPRAVAVKTAPTPCPICGATFRPHSNGLPHPTETCSMRCGVALRMSRGHEHPRGATGIVHSEATRAAVGAAARKMWANMSDEDRAIRAEASRAGVRKRVDAGVDASRTHTRAAGGRRTDIDNHYFRSSWEANYARWMNWQIQHDLITSWHYEVKTFRFPVQRGTMSYTPDFLVTHLDGRTEWHEVKGWMTQRGATALARFAKYYPDEVLVLIDAPAYRALAKDAKPLLPNWEGSK